MTNVYRDPRVMVGNWSEDRAEPLEGVLVDYGYRSYNTTSGDAFPVPSKSPPKDQTRRGKISKLCFVRAPTRSPSTRHSVHVHAYDPCAAICEH